MIPSPLHPAVVHFPIVLAVLLPIFALVAVWAIARGRATRLAWSIPVVMAFLLAISAFVALQTGKREEDRAEKVVAENLIKQHEEAAETFLIAASVLALLSVAGLMRGSRGTWARVVTTGGTAVVLLLGFNVGKAGGELVYKHGAAQAYAPGTTGAENQSTPAQTKGDEDSD